MESVFFTATSKGMESVFFYSNKQGEGECFFFFLCASSSGIANIICMVAGIIYFEKPVRSGIHSTSVIAR